MKILVTGAKGMLGQDLCPTLMDEGYEVIETDVDTMDITNIENVRKVLDENKPNFIIHCAAYTNVDKAEQDLETAQTLNVEGAKNVAICANEINASMIYISTDYVFDGTKNNPYLPSDKPNPINNYGLTKLQGEIEVQKNCPKSYILRTSWLYGHNGKNFVETMLALKDKEELKVVDDQIGCPTWTMDLASAIVEIIQNKPCGIYHVCGGGMTSWYGFAKKIFELSNLKVNLKPCTTDEFPREAKRPKFSAMNNNGLLRDWTLALKDYLALRIEDEENVEILEG